MFIVTVFDSFKKNALIKTAYNLTNQCKYQEALECYNKILETDLYYIKAWYGKGVVLEELENYQESLVCYDKALELDPNYFDVWYNKGVHFS